MLDSEEMVNCERLQLAERLLVAMAGGRATKDRFVREMVAEVWEAAGKLLECAMGSSWSKAPSDVPESFKATIPDPETNRWTQMLHLELNRHGEAWADLEECRMFEVALTAERVYYTHYAAAIPHICCAERWTRRPCSSSESYPASSGGPVSGSSS